MTNQFPGLARGPIDHNASSVINVIADDAITMGSLLKLKDLVTPTISSELLPRVEETTGGGTESAYGIAVGGDTDGIYGDGSTATDDSTRATASAGQGVVVVTQGRCLARVTGFNTTGGGANISVGDALAPSEGSVSGTLVQGVGTAGLFVIARALQPVASGETDIIAVDIQREGSP